MPAAPITMGTDGGMNRVFVAKLAETAAGLRRRRAAARAADPSRHAAADAERAAGRPRGGHDSDAPTEAKQAVVRRFVWWAVQRQDRRATEPQSSASRRVDRHDRRKRERPFELLRQPVQARRAMQQTPGAASPRRRACRPESQSGAAQNRDAKERPQHCRSRRRRRRRSNRKTTRSRTPMPLRRPRATA